MKMSARRSNSAPIILATLASALLQSSGALAACAESGGSDICVGPEVGEFTYLVSDGSLSAGGKDEAATIEAYVAKVSANMCTFSMTDNAPGWPAAPYGSGNQASGNYSAALFAGNGTYRQMSWIYGTVQHQERIPLRIERTYWPPSCTGSVTHGAYVSRQRTVACPYQYLSAPGGGVNAYCYRTLQSRDTPKNLGSACPTGTCPAGEHGGIPTMLGNPINGTNGNKFQEELDYPGAGSSPLRFVRYYNSTSSTVGLTSALGPRWRSSYERAVRFAESQSFPTVFAYRPDGRRLYFKLQSGQFVADADIADRLVQLLDGSGNLTGWEYTIAGTQEVETYDVNGRLLAIRTRSGIAQTLQYAGDLLSSVTDSFGHQLTFTYDANGRLLTMVDPNGQTFTYGGYTAQGNVGSVTYPDLTARAYLYGEASYVSGSQPNSLTGITDEATNRYATFKYDQYARGTSSEHAGGVEKYVLTYPGTPVPSQVTVTDPLLQQRTYLFSTVTFGLPRLSSVSRAGGASVSTTYDSNANVASKTDFNGNKICYAYDLTRNLETVRVEGFASGISCPSNLASYTPTAGTRQRKISTAWHSSFRLPIQIDEPGKRTTFTHDTNGNVLTRTVLDTATSESRTWTYTYNSFGQVLTADGPRTDVSDVTTYTYYSCATGYECGQVHTIENALGHVTTYNTYNAHGQPLTITDPNGVVTTLTYDLRQRLTSRTIGSEQTTFDYWPTGLLKKATLPDGSFLQYTYDAAHRLTQIDDSEGNHIVYTLDNMGNRTAENLYDPSSVLTQTRTRVFNTLNQLWKELGAAGTAAVTTTFTYDNNGNQTGIAAPLLRNTAQTYDELNRLKQVTDPLSGITQYGYNALDQLISVTDPRSKVTNYTYNALGDLTQQVSPDTGTTANTYDSGGNLATSTDARSKTGTYAYDALNRITSLTYPDQTITYTYDSGTNQKGRLTQVSDGSGSTSWSYDTHGRVLSRQQSMGVTETLGYAYDSFGRLQTLTLPSGNTITYGYTDGKITSLTLNGSTTILSNVLYQPFGPTRGWTWGNSTQSIREYDTDGKITDIDSAGLKTYSYDDAFRITGITDAANSSLSQNYGYDLLDRLTSATGTSLNQGWTYDANGNRLTQTGSAASTLTVSSTSNRLSSVSGALSRTYSYDGSGNTTGDGSATFTYNDAGRMVSVTKASVTTTYALNALGQRVKKTTSGSSTYFVSDEVGHLVGEYDSSGNLIQETVWLRDTPVAVLRPNGTGVNLFYVHTDHLHAPRRISRPSDNVVVWRWDSDPFGTSAAGQDPDNDSTLFTYNLRLPGQYFDIETGLHYNYLRDYDPAVGRYVHSDPLGLKGGLNTYAYVDGHPIARIDPYGLIKLPANPTGLPPNWEPDPSHRDPNGERWTNGTDWLDFHKGRPGMPGWRGKDHWHKDGGEDHLLPGDDCPTADDPPSQPDPEPEPTIDPETQQQIIDGTVKAGVVAILLRFLPILLAL